MNAELLDVDTYWVECYVRPGAKLRSIYETAADAGALSIHHFNFEPWHPMGAAVRVMFEDSGEALIFKPEYQALRDHSDVEAVHRWDETNDHSLYGDWWPPVRDFFAATSKLAAGGTWPEAGLLKLTHCHLNAHGLNVGDEARFLAKFFWNRLTIRWKYRKAAWMKARGMKAQEWV